MEPFDNTELENVPTNDSSLENDTPDEDDTLQFNIGGTRFETRWGTLERTTAECRLTDKTFLHRHYRPKYDDYFFDRDPSMFRAMLNYLITGELHLPSSICGPSAKTELEYWGVSPSKIERCCWMNYNDWNSTLEALQNLERDRKVTMMTRDVGLAGDSKWEKFRRTMWRLLNRTNSSILARIFGLVALFFVCLSIFSFLAETTEEFKYTETRANRSQVVTTATTVSIETTSAGITTMTPRANMTMDTTSSSETQTHSQSSMKVDVKHPVLYTIDMVCLAYFILEYVTRLIFAPKKFKYVTSLMAVIDVLAILPDCIEIIISEVSPHYQENNDAVLYISTVRIIRVLRIFRLIRHVPGLWILVYTLRASVSELMLMVWFMLLGILVFSSLIYYVDERDNFQSIPHGFWWALITMTTVGYGDMYPTTVLGKIVGSLCAMSGVLMIGFTVPALVNNFMLYYRHLHFDVQAEQQKEHDLNQKVERDKISDTQKAADLEFQGTKDNEESIEKNGKPNKVYYEPNKVIQDSMNANHTGAYESQL